MLQTRSLDIDLFHINGEQSIEDVHKDIMTALQSQ